MNKKTIALITARGGSVRLPRKNILSFCGHPLVAWSIIQARCSRFIDEVYMTTDDQEIAEIGERYGAKVITRPVYDNNISAGYVLKLALEQIMVGNEIETVVLMLPTSPLKKIFDLDELILAYKKSGSKYMEVFCPDKECFIYANYSSFENNENNFYFLQPVITDKSWKYSRGGIGWNIADCKYFLDQWNNKSPYDSVIDSNLQNDSNNAIKENRMVFGYPIETWQMFETDYESYFKLCELIMEAFILKGQGMKVYINYAKSHGKIIDYEVRGISDLSRYIGNIRQLEEG